MAAMSLLCFGPSLLLEGNVPLFVEVVNQDQKRGQGCIIEGQVLAYRPMPGKIWIAPGPSFGTTLRP